jgi:serine/threonine protein kinase
LEERHEIAPGRSVLALLGGGHSYEVYLVWDDALFAVMVAKLLRPDLVDDEHALRGLRREAEALERLAHPVVLRGFGAVLDGPYPHVLVEHLEGPTLRRLIKRGGALSLEQLLPLGLQVASAIHYLAGQGMVHLDIKPDNIVMGIPPRLIDLSLARTVERARRLRDWIGTNAYMPPEQCAPGEAGEPGPHSDVWGLGATLYHAAAGRLPFPRPVSTAGDATPEQRFPQLHEPPLPFPESLPDPLGAAIMPCLRAEPAERPTAAELAQSLEPLVAALPKKLVLGRRGAVGA